MVSRLRALLPRSRPKTAARNRGLILVVIAATLLVAYALAGFVLLPWVAKRELPRLVEEKLEHRAQLGELDFNPFTLTLRARDFALEDRGGGPVLAFAEAAVDLEWRSLAQRAWVFAEVRLLSPAVQLQISKAGRLNLAALLPPADATSDAATAAQAARLTIGRLALENGRIGFEDQREGYRNALEGVSLELASLSTLDAQTGSYTLTGQTPGGTQLRWKGEMSLAPPSASGSLAIGNAALAELMPYFDEFIAARVTSGRATLELPYRFALTGGEPQLSLSDAKLEVQDLALAAPGGRPALFKLGRLALEGVDFDSSTRKASATALRVADAALNATRDAHGALDLVRILAVKADSGQDMQPDAMRQANPDTRPGLEPMPWQASIAALEVGNVAAHYTDASARIPAAFTLRGLNGKARLAAQSGANGVQVRIDAGEFALAQFDARPEKAQPASQSPFLRLGNVSIAGASFDSGANALDIAAVRVATLDANTALQDGRWSLLDLLPAAGTGKPAQSLAARIKAIELGGGSVSLADRTSGVALRLERLSMKLAGVSTDTTQPLAFEVSAGVKSGGRIGLRGRLVPAQGMLDAKLEASAVALAPLQAMLARYASVKLASGDASLSGTLKAGGRQAKLAYAGTASVTNVALDDTAGTRLLGWESLATESLRFSLTPDRVEIDELRWIAPAGKLAIAKDGTSNLSRAFARKDAARKDAGSPTDAATAAPRAAAPGAANAAAPPDAEAAFAVAVRRARVEQGTLDFSDDSLSPGYVAKIYELVGTVNGLSSDQSTRSQFDLEGRVDEFGYARLSGSINPFVPRERSAFRVQLRNIDLATASPYSMRFAGYRIASGRMSVDLNYRVRASVIEGDNKITLEKLTLGERVESPDAFKLPLELAIALLKDADGTIAMDVPVTGNLDDPQFRFAPIIWKAIGNFLGGIVAAPFRALARLLGGGTGEEAGAIAFEPGGSRLQPPEREKIGRIVEALAKRPELKLQIPGRYDTEADARALKRDALARDIARRAGFAVSEEERPGPINPEDRPTRAALRTLFAERFSATELDKLKTDAEQKARAAGAPAPTLADRVRNFAADEPQVADAREFYATLLRRLRDAQALPPNALSELAQKRALAIADALRAAGVEPTRIARSTAEPGADAEAKQVTLQLSLAAR